MRIRRGPALVGIEVPHISQHKGRCFSGVQCLDVDEVNTLDIFQYKSPPQVILYVPDFDIMHLDSLYMTNVETVCRHNPKPFGLGIATLQFEWLDRGVVFCAAALVENEYVAQFQIFNIVAGDPRYDRSLAGSTI